MSCFMLMSRRGDVLDELEQVDEHSRRPLALHVGGGHGSGSWAAVAVGLSAADGGVLDGHEGGELIQQVGVLQSQRPGGGGQVH